MTPPRRRWSFGRALDGFFFVFGGVAAIWLAYLSLTQSFSLGWGGVLMAIAFWVLLAYLALPRLHRILTAIYVPDYFMGRTRTSDGLLGDPVNLALQGSRESVEAAMAAAGWIPADPVSLGSSWRIIASTVRRRSYPRAPVSPLYLFGRMQDLAYQQEVAGSPAKRHHVRLWKCPDGWLLPGGRRVDWLAAGTFDRAVGLSLFTLQVTHRIDADTDIERDHIVGTLRGLPGVEVDVIRDFATGYHSRNGGGDSISTDGDLPIIDVSAVRLPARPGGVGHMTGERHPDKRPAFEPPLDPTAADPAMRRPVSIVTGSVLVLLRAAAGALWAVSVAFSLPPWLRAMAGAASGDANEPLDLTVSDLGVGTAVFLAVLGGVFVVQVVFGILILVGSNLARVLVMLLSVASISASFVGWWAYGQEITVGTTLVTLSLDILVLLALSSRDAAAYARRKEGRRGRRRDART
jgi:hypothetical protein